MKRQIAIEIICSLFIFLFGYASITKLMDIERFQAQIGQSPLLTSIAVPVSWIIPGLELLIAMLLMLQRSRMTGLLLSLILMVMFTIYITIIMNFSERIPCSCGGVLQNMGWGEHLAFNLAFVALGIAGVVQQYKLMTKKTPSFKDILLQ